MPLLPLFSFLATRFQLYITILPLVSSTYGLGQVKRLETLLFPPSAKRPYLRIDNFQPHVHINLQDQLGQGTDLNALRSDLITLAKPRH